MAAVETILSMGLDIGTTTTVLVISKLTLRNVAGGFVVPRIEIVDKEILHRSPVFFTPLLEESRLDGERIRRLVEKEYQLAGIQPEEVRSGAVIITGEAAGRENARELLPLLARFAGGFVVSTAGPHLEAIIAGKGSGAAACSQRQGKAILNVDVGGGTTNAALFSRGEVLDTAAVRVGGRLLELDPETLVIKQIAPPLRELIEHEGLALAPGQVLSPTEAGLLCRAMGRIIEESLGLGSVSPLAASLLLGEPLGREEDWDGIMFTGGVAEGLYDGVNLEAGEVFQFGDIGLLLGLSLSRSPLAANGKLMEPLETRYATVIGAGMQLTELSGSTIYISRPEILPLYDLPVIKPFAREMVQATTEELVEAISRGVERVRTEDGALQALALRLHLPRNPPYSLIKTLAESVVSGMDDYLEAGYPLVLVVDSDAGKALGYAVSNLLSPDVPVVSVDQVAVEHGDYIDIGQPLYQGAVVPIAVKTLVFPD